LIRYYGEWSHVRRARAQPTRCASAQPTQSPDAQNEFARSVRRSWARLIKRVYEADPLLCPRCGRALNIVSLIDDCAAIERILRHLKLWDRPERPPPPRPERTLCYDVWD
jgi:hypothetical protein